MVKPTLVFLRLLKVVLNSCQSKLQGSATFNSHKNTKVGLTIYLHFTQGTIWVDDVELIEVK